MYIRFCVAMLLGGPKAQRKLVETVNEPLGYIRRVASGKKKSWRVETMIKRFVREQYRKRQRLLTLEG